MANLAVRLPGVVLLEGALADFPGSLPPEELALLSERAVPKRREQFAAARNAGRRALAELGAPVQAIGRAESGAPLWPADVSGSLTHGAQRCAAVVAWSRDWLALGVDIEALEALPQGVDELVLRPEETETLAALPGGVAHWGRMVFGAKECVHKAIHPLRGAFLDFLEVRIEVGLDGSWTPHPVSETARAAFSGLQPQGRYQAGDGYWLSLLGLRP